MELEEEISFTEICLKSDEIIKNSTEYQNTENKVDVLLNKLRPGYNEIESLREMLDETIKLLKLQTIETDKYRVRCREYEKIIENKHNIISKQKEELTNLHQLLNAPNDKKSISKNIYIMSRVKTIHDKTNTITLKKDAVLNPESETTEQFYGNVMNQFKTVIQDQNNILQDKERKLQVVEKAYEMNNINLKKELEKQKKEIEDYKMKVKLLDQEVEYHRSKDTNKSSSREDARKIIKELHEINLKRRDIKITEAELDEEAKEYIKKFQ